MGKTLENNLEERAETVIGPSAIIQGELTSEGSIKIEGQLTGTINTSQTIIVSENAKVTAEVEAESAVIGGEVQGHLNISGRLVLLSAARVAADITCPTLKVEEGALFTGKCHMACNIPTVHIKKAS